MSVTLLQGLILALIVFAFAWVQEREKIYSAA